MWAAIKALTWQAKLGISIGILAILIAIMGSTAYVSYQKGLNVSKVQIERFQTDIQTLNTKLATAQGKTDVQTVTLYKDRIQYIDRVQYKTKTIVQTIVPEQYNLSEGWVYAYNQSVAGAELDPALAGRTEASKTTDRMALETITENNARYLAAEAQLESLQDWILKTKANYEEVNKSIAH